jgi:hypothetical protein
MPRKRWWVVGILALVAALAVVGVGVVLDPLLPNRLYLKGGQLEVSAVSAGLFSPVRLEGDARGPIVQLGKHTAHLTAQEVELSDGRSIPIPRACRRLEVRESRGGILVLFDGVEAR